MRTMPRHARQAASAALMRSCGSRQQCGVEPVQANVLQVLLEIVQLLVAPLAQQLQWRQGVQGFERSQAEERT